MKNAMRLRVGMWLLALAGVLMLVSPLSAAPANGKAEQIAHAMMEAMGGPNAWNQAHYVRFDFKVMGKGKVLASRSHLWDKWSGNYRLEFSPKPGQHEVVLFNVNTHKGTAYLDGKALSGAENDKQVKSAYGMFINDMYWLAMPWKWLDSGVHLRYVGKKMYAGKDCDVVELTFGHVGLTPGDRYDAFVAPDSHLMIHWEYHLQSHQTGSWDWHYGDHHGMKLASTHTNAQGMQINMGDVQVPSQVDNAFFTDPSHDLSQLK